jgi:hypothetical protein
MCKYTQLIFGTATRYVIATAMRMHFEKRLTVPTLTNETKVACISYEKVTNDDFDGK